MIFPCDKGLTFKEIGLLSAMLNLPRADYSSITNLASLSNDSPNSVQDTLNSLISKEYVLTYDGKYVVKKEKIPFMAVV